MRAPTKPLGLPLILPLGDSGLMVRFGATLSDDANRAAIASARRLRDGPPAGVTEIVPNLVSVLLKYDPKRVSFEALAGEVRLRLGEVGGEQTETATHRVAVTFDGEDVSAVAAALKLSPEAFVAAHCASPLRVLATGFAPGFVYCGFHPEALASPRRTEVRAMVPAGTVLFAARQTAIASTPIPTGWHVIGHTDFSNFEPAEEPPTRLGAGDRIVFEAVS